MSPQWEPEPGPAQRTLPSRDQWVHILDRVFTFMSRRKGKNSEASLRKRLDWLYRHQPNNVYSINFLKRKLEAFKPVKGFHPDHPKTASEWVKQEENRPRWKGNLWKFSKSTDTISQWRTGNSPQGSMVP